MEEKTRTKGDKSIREHRFYFRKCISGVFMYIFCMQNVCQHAETLPASLHQLRQHAEISVATVPPTISVMGNVFLKVPVSISLARLYMLISKHSSVL